jgi:hypothetical protein
VPKEHSGELLISCLDLSRVGYLCPDMPFSLARVSRSPIRGWQEFDIKYPEKIFFKDIEAFPDTQKLYV